MLSAASFACACVGATKLDLAGSVKIVTYGTKCLMDQESSGTVGGGRSLVGPTSSSWQGEVTHRNSAFGALGAAFGALCNSSFCQGEGARAEARTPAAPCRSQWKTAAYIPCQPEGVNRRWVIPGWCKPTHVWYFSGLGTFRLS